MTATKAQLRAEAAQDLAWRGLEDRLLDIERMMDDGARSGDGPLMEKIFCVCRGELYLRAATRAAIERPSE